MVSHSHALAVAKSISKPTTNRNTNSLSRYSRIIHSLSSITQNAQTKPNLPTPNLTMASLHHILFSLSLLLLIALSAAAAQSAFQISTDTLDHTTSTFYTEQFGEEEDEFAFNRRSLFWNRPIHYYISYGALSANRIPCPPRSGRSYYTHNCHRARGPVHPYSRGCSAISRCRR